MGLQISGYNEDGFPEYEWVADPVDQYITYPDTTSTDTSNTEEQNTPTVRATGDVDASGNPTYVDINGNPVTADGTPIGSANERTPLEGGGFKTVNPNGSVTYQDPDGSVYTVNPNGTYTTQSEGSTWTYDPKQNAFVDAAGNALGAGTGMSAVFDKIKSAFKNPDGSYDWKKILAAGTAAASMSGLNKANKTPTGYQGGIPTLQAIRSQIPGAYDPNRRAGSSGQRYFSDMAYVNPADTAATQAAQTKIAQSASDIIAANKANPAYEAKSNIVRTAPVGTGMMQAPAPTTPAAGVAGIYSPQELQSLMAKIPVKAAEGGIMEMAKGRYLRGDTDGMADKLNTSIDGTQPAKLSHGEFVIPADVVSHLGNGNSDAGAKKLYSMMDKIRMARTGTKKQGKEINPDHFMPGGIASTKEAKKFVVGGSTGTNVGSAVNAGVTGTESNLSNWAGPYVTGMLGQAQALGAKPYEAYQGPLTAGASSVQQEAFQNAANLNVPTESMGGFKPQAFGAEQAQQYMNPYLQAALKPQLEEQRRQAQINLQPSLSKLTQAGGFGGGRQAIMESEANRNLQAQQNQTIGQGYMDAYNKAMQQFNTEQNAAQQAQSLTNQYGLQALQQQAGLGAQQRGIESEGIAADIAQFEQEKLDPYKKLQFQQSMLQGLPVQAQQYNVADQSTLQKVLGALSDTSSASSIVKNLQDLGVIPKSSTTTTG